MKKYKTKFDLPEIKAGTTLLRSMDNIRYFLTTDTTHYSWEIGYVESHPEFFSIVNAHPTKEEIIESIFVLHGNDTFNRFDAKRFTKSCMDAHCESVKEQLIEKLNEAVAHYPITSVPYFERKAVLDIIRNFNPL